MSRQCCFLFVAGAATREEKKRSHKHKRKGKTLLEPSSIINSPAVPPSCHLIVAYELDINTLLKRAVTFLMTE
jgi:hypothetical protein